MIAKNTKSSGNAMGYVVSSVYEYFMKERNP